jgi:hypothetical protein
MMRMQGNQVSFSVEKDGGSKIWDSGQCEVVGEGICDGEAEGEGQEFEVDEQELQLALAMSEEDPRMDEELAKRLSELDSVPVSTYLQSHHLESHKEEKKNTDDPS